ncbi:Myosin-2 [Bienertia sinuspersici]
MGVLDFVGAPMIAFYVTDAIKTLSHKEAKSSIYSGQDINWVIIAPNDTTSVKYVDDSMQSQQVIDFLLSVRSCFLTLRYDDNCIAEPYSPHRFSRQFGFYQDIPGKLKPPPEKVTWQYLYSLFQTSVQLGTYSSFVNPARGLKMNLRVTDSYTSWWKSIYSSSMNSLNLQSPSESSEGRRSKSQKRKADNTPPHDKDAKATRDSYRKGPLKTRLTCGSSTCSPKEPAMRGTKGDQSRYPSRSSKDGKFSKDKDRASNYQANFDIAAELNACNNSFGAIDDDLLTTASDPVVLYAASTIIARNSEVVHDAPPIQTVAPSFKAQDMISEADLYAVGFLVKQMKTRLLHTPLNNTPVLDPELQELFGNIALKNNDVTSLHEHVDAYVSHASSFHALDSSENVQPSLSSLEERLTDVESRLSDVKELKLLEQKKSELSSALATSEDSFGKHDAAVTELTVSHSSIEEEIAATREATTKRKKAE